VSPYQYVPGNYRSPAPSKQTSQEFDTFAIKPIKTEKKTVEEQTPSPPNIFSPITPTTKRTKSDTLLTHPNFSLDVEEIRSTNPFTEERKSRVFSFLPTDYDFK